jgi:ATP-binding cassette subfamily C protein
MKRSGFQIMARLVGLVKPLSGYMILAITMGLIGHLCAAFITVFGGFAILQVLHPEWYINPEFLFAAVLIFALVRGFLRYA